MSKHGAFSLWFEKVKVFCERPFALLRQQPENHIQMSTLAPHGKVSADAHGYECVLLPCLKIFADDSGKL